MCHKEKNNGEKVDKNIMALIEPDVSFKKG